MYVNIKTLRAEHRKRTTMHDLYLSHSWATMHDLCLRHSWATMHDLCLSHSWATMHACIFVCMIIVGIWATADAIFVHNKVFGPQLG